MQMKVLKISDYMKKGVYNYPSEKISPEKKLEKDWYLQQVKAMTHLYATNQCDIPFRIDSNSETVSIDTLRAYAKGRQGNKMVKRMLFKESKECPGKFKTKMKNIFQNYDVLPEMFDVIRAINQRQEFELNATATDYDSIKEKALEKSMVKFLIKKETQELLSRANYKVNSTFSPEELSSMTDADVDTIFDGGGFLLQKELASLACCEESKRASGHKEIENLITDDIITIGKSGIKVVVDRATQTIKYKWVNLRNAFLPSSMFEDYRDITRAGEYRKMTISDLREINPDLTAEQLNDLVEGYAFLNPDYQSLINNTGQFQEDEFNQSFDKCVVWVFDAQWLSTDYKTKLITKSKDGNDLVRDVKYAYELNSQENRKGAKLKRTKVIKKHQAIWVVGTDILLEYGQAEDTAYYGKSGNKTPKLDYFFAKTNNMSLIERCIPHVDDINLNTIKLRNAVATLPPAPRMVIQQQLLDNVFLNNIKQSPEDLIATLQEVGYLVVNGVDDHGRPIYQNGKAIDFIQSGLAEDVNLFNGLINDSINRIRQVLGLPEGLDGTSGNPYTGKGQTEMAAAASSNALFPTLSKVNTIFNPAFTHIVKTWQVYSKGKTLEVSFSPLGSTTIEILKLGAEFPKADINVEMKLSLNQEQKQFLLGQLNEMSLQYTQSQGAFGTSKAEYMLLFDMIMAGRVKLAMFKIAQIEKRREATTALKQKQDQEFNIQSQQQSAITTAEELRKSIALENDEKRKTAIVTEAQKRKTAATTAYMKTFDIEGQPMSSTIYESIMSEANAEIAASLSPTEGTDDMMTANSPEQQQEQLMTA